MDQQEVALLDQAAGPGVVVDAEVVHRNASVASSRRHIVATLTPQNVARSSMRRKGHRSSQCKSSQSIMPAA